MLLAPIGSAYMTATVEPMTNPKGPRPHNSSCLTPSASPERRSFVAEKRCASSDDESDEGSIPLRYRARKRRRTLCVAGLHANAPPSPRMDSGSSENEFLSSVMLRRQQHLRRRSIASDADRNARQRCFDYLLSGIDAVWAEYCDSTLLAEEQRYTPRSPVSDVSDHEKTDAVSEQPHSVQLMRLKKRLLASKYYMTDLVGKHDPDCATRFWKAWDAVKYPVVDLVEGEGDDEENDAVIDDLEEGRLF